MKLLLILLLICSNSAISKVFDTNPQDIETIDIPNGYKTVVYNKRYTFAIPKDYKIKRASDFGFEFLAITSTSGSAVLSVDEIPASNKILFNPERYGLNNYSRRELISAIYDKNHVSNVEVNETRKLIFKLSNIIEVYKRDGFLFFREDRNDDLRTKASFTVSTPVNDDVLSIGFLVGDEELIMNVIKSLKVN